MAAALVAMSQPTLGALTAEERHAAALHFAALAKSSSALARIFDPSVKAKAGRPKKDETGIPKPKRKPTAYNTFMAQHLKEYKTQVRRAACCEARAGTQSFLFRI